MCLMVIFRKKNGVLGAMFAIDKGQIDLEYDGTYTIQDNKFSSNIKQTQPFLPMNFGSKCVYLPSV